MPWEPAALEEPGALKEGDIETPAAGSTGARARSMAAGGGTARGTAGASQLSGPGSMDHSTAVPPYVFQPAAWAPGSRAYGTAASDSAADLSTVRDGGSAVWSAAGSAPALKAGSSSGNSGSSSCWDTDAHGSSACASGGDRQAGRRPAGETGGAADRGGSKRGMRVVFRDLEYWVRNAADRRQRLAILQGVSGFFNPGQLAAVLGPSGSGKSTLLDVLAGRKTAGETRGAVLFGGQRPSAAFLRRYTAYVEQADTLLPELTVAEMLAYTAHLTRPRTEPTAAKRAAVAQVLARLALQGCAGTRIGDALNRGISGGQAKRTNVALALLTSPRVLFLDEPSTGLDSYTAHEVMTTVKALVADGMTICATIHCPPASTFQLFDSIFILQRGRTVYFGDNGAAASAYFQGSLPEKVPALGPRDSLAEWVVGITTAADRAGDAGDALARAYQASQLRAGNDERLEELLAADAANPSFTNLKELAVRRGTVTPGWYALAQLLRFRALRNYRSAVFVGARGADKALFTLLIFSFYWGVGRSLAESNVPNVAGALFFWVILPAYGASPYIPALVLERPLTVRERADGLYSAGTYLAFKLVEELALALVLSVAFSVPVWYACALRGSFFIFWLAFLVTLANGVAVAYLIAAVSPSIDVANSALPAYVTTLLFAAGYLLRWADIPRYWIWYAYINFLWYGWGALMINHFGGTGATTYGGQEVLQYYNLDGRSAWAFLAYEALFFVGYVAAAWAALAFVRVVKR